MPIRFDHPVWLSLLLLLGPVIAWGWRGLQGVDPWRGHAILALRCLVILLLTLMLAGMEMTRRQNALTVVAVVDRSESVRRFAQPPAHEAGTDASQDIESWTQQWIAEQARQRRPDDRLGMVTYDGRPTVRAMPSVDGLTDAVPISSPVEGTDTAGAIRMAMALFDAASARRMVLVTDGNTGSGESDLLAAAREAAAAGVLIDVLPLEYALTHEVMVDRLIAPVQLHQDQSAALRVVLRATAPADGTLHLRHDGKPLSLVPDSAGGMPVHVQDWTVESAATGLDPASASANASGGQYVLVRRFQVDMAESGPHRFEAFFEPAKVGDQMPANNRAEAMTRVQGKGRIVVVDGVGGESGQILPNLLRRRGMDVLVIDPADLPDHPAELVKDDAILFQNVPAEAVPPARQEMIRQYVNDLGGGFIMIGGPDSFGAGGWTGSPIDPILPVTCHVPSQRIAPLGALVLVIDRSGSMHATVGTGTVTQMQVANEAAVLAVSTLYPQDRFGVVGFDSKADWVIDLGTHADRANVFKTIRAINAAGGTNIYDGLNLAYEALAPLTERDAAVRHILLMTDGRTQGNTDFNELTQKIRARGITVSTVGIGNGVDTELLEKLAQRGGGTFHAVQDAALLPYIFVKEARTIRKHLIHEKPFVPRMGDVSPITTGLEDMPPLKGLVLTGRRPDARVSVPLEGLENEPVLAHWQVGVGRTAAFTSDATNRWAAAWIAWPGYTDLWTRLVRTVARPAATQEYEVHCVVRNGQLHVRLDTAATSRDATPAAVLATVLTPDGQIKHMNVRRIGPGVYAGDIPAEQEGSYMVNLALAGTDGRRQFVIGGATRTPGAELRDMRSNRQVLEQIAAVTGGRVLDPTQTRPDLLFERSDAIRPTLAIRPAWRVLLVLLLIALMLDIAIRRVAWDVLLQQWRMGMDRVKPVVQTVPRIPPAPTSPQPVAQPTESVVFKPVATAKPKPQRPAATPSGPTTSRLLDAKRRARQRMDESDQPDET
ncbi:MAG: VWA domain-containing protein [Phycisphaeraceae bacterium]|nr:VWA domain-containing protein [Phycisphaeraceae bacterium]